MAQSDAALSCAGCSADYPIIAGIPDLRIFPDPYIALEDDRAKARRIAEQSGSCSFRELVDYYYRHTPAVPPSHAERFTRGLIAGERRASAALRQWEDAIGATVSRSARLLELGCGTAPFLVAASDRCGPMVGIDLALRWLVVGRKRLEEAGVEALLVCCCAEALPFEDGQFDVVVADSAIEHFRDQDRALDSASRILRPEGVLFLATPNGASPGPDPHLGLLGGALLPDRLIRAYARRVGAVPPARHLLTARALLRKLRGAGFAGIEIFAPRISTAQVQGSTRLVRAAVRVYNALGRFGPTRTLRRAIGPLLFAVARRR